MKITEFTSCNLQFVPNLNTFWSKLLWLLVFSNKKMKEQKLSYLKLKKFCCSWLFLPLFLFWHQQSSTKCDFRPETKRGEQKCRIEQKKWKIGQNQTFPRKGQGFSPSLWNAFPWDYKSADCQNWVICWWYQWFYTLKKVHWWEENYWYFVHKRPDWNAWKAVIAFQE